jgi:hypothetical protein
MGDSPFSSESPIERLVQGCKMKQVENDREFLPVIEMNGTKYLIDIKQKELAA